MNKDKKKSHIPSIVNIKTQEKEIEILLAQYKTVNASYINNLNQRFRDKAAQDLTTMADLNDRITSLLSSIRQEISTIYPKGISNQSAVTLNVQKVKALDSKLKKNEKELQIMMAKEMALDGQYESSTLDVYSYKYHYMFYFIVAVIIAWLLYRVFSTNVSDDKIETVILVCAIIVLFYHFLLKHVLASLDSAGNYVSGQFKNLNI
jgi:hypothetical protein